MELIEKPLGAKGIGYVKSCLRKGKGLSSLLLPSLSSRGQTFAPLPEGTEQGRAEEFEVGGLLPRRKMKEWVSSHLGRLCRDRPESSILFQDLWVAPSDPAVLAAKSRKILTESEVYYFIQGENFHSRLVETAIDDLISYLLVGVFTH